MAQLEVLLYENEDEIRHRETGGTATTSLVKIRRHARLPRLRASRVSCFCNVAIYPEAIQKLTH